MEVNYGSRLFLRNDVDLAFICEAIYPSGQMGYTETHYKIKAGGVNIVLSKNSIQNFFTLSNPNPKKEVSKGLVEALQNPKPDEAVKVLSNRRGRPAKNG